MLLWNNLPTRHTLQHWALPGVLCAILALSQPWLEKSMARHMGMELPILFMVGWLAGSRCMSLSTVLAPWNKAGLPGMTWAMLTLSLWMVPSALDYAVLSPLVAMMKVTSLLAAGMLARLSWQPAGLVIQAFFVMNWFWMTFAAGALYLDAPQQLCSVYLVDEQAHAGIAMMAWACLGLSLWASEAFRALR